MSFTLEAFLRRFTPQDQTVEELEIEDTLNIIELVDESLDEASITVKSDNTNYKRLDKVTLLITDSSGSLGIDFIISGVKSVISSKQPILYTNTLTLIEPTFKLEGTWCSEIAYTQPLDKNEPRRYNNVYEMLLRLNNIAPISLSSDLGSTRLVNSFSPELTAEAMKTPAPQLKIKGLNVRDGYNYIMDTLDGICRLNNQGELGIDFYNKRSTVTTIDLEDIIEYEEEREMALYGTSIESMADNIVSDDKYTKNIVAPGDFILQTFRTDDVIFTEDTATINTEFPIDVAERVTFWYYEIDQVDDGFGGNIDKRVIKFLDITDYSFEEQQWDLLFLKRIGDSPTKAFKQNSIKYKRKQRSWFGFGTKNKAGISVFSSVVFNEMLKSAAARDNVNAPTLDLEDSFVQIKYAPYIKKSRIIQHRTNYSDVNKNFTVRTNQSSTTINFERYSSNLHGQIQRIGNKEIELSMKFYKLSELKPLNAYVTNFDAIIAVRDIQFYKDFGVVTYRLVKEFNRINKFIGIDQEVRQYDVPLTSDRMETYVDFIMVTPMDESTDIGEVPYLNTSSITNDGMNAFMNILDESGTIDPIYEGEHQVQSCLVSSQENLGNTNYLIKIVSPKGGKNILKFDIQFNGSIFAGNKIIPFDSPLSPVGMFEDRPGTEGVSYTDINDAGKLDEIALIFGKKPVSNQNNLKPIGDLLPAIKPENIDGLNLINLSGGDFVNSEKFTSQDMFYEYNIPSIGSTQIETFSIDLDGDKVVETISLQTLSQLPDLEASGGITLNIKVGLETVYDQSLSLFDPQIINLEDLGKFADTVTFTITIDLTKAADPRDGVVALTDINILTLPLVPTPPTDGIAIYKEIGETLGISYQIEAIPFNNNEFNTGGYSVVVGNDFCRRNRLVGGIKKENSLKVYLTDEVYDENDKFLKDGVPDATLRYEYTVLSTGMTYLTLWNVDGGRRLKLEKTWAIGDNDGNLIFASNLGDVVIEIIEEVPVEKRYSTTLHLFRPVHKNPQIVYNY